MKRTLKRIAPLQFGKIIGLLYGLISLLFTPFILLVTVLGSLTSDHVQQGPPTVVMAGIGLILCAVIPMLYAAMGFVVGIIGAAIYNLLARMVGGIEFEVE
jgi:flagellar biosynthesis protein FliP